MFLENDAKTFCASVFIHFGILDYLFIFDSMVIHIMH